MDLSHPNKIRCRLRKEFVAATPEEKVRQNLLRYLIEDLGYPSANFAIERSLRALIGRQGIPDRRIDLLFYYKGELPTILFECKEDRISDSALLQVIGYNTFIGSPYICLAGRSTLKFGTATELIDTIPAYCDLIANLYKS